MAYYIRNKAGEAKAKVSNDFANKIMRDSRGHFRQANYRAGKKTVFEIEGDYTLGTDNYKILLWVGDILEPVD